MTSFTVQYFPVAVILLAGMVYSVKRDKLTMSGAITGAVIGALVFAGTGYSGLGMMICFFLLGTMATSWEKGSKLKLNELERRTAAQVFANSGIAAFCALLILVFPDYHMALSIAFAGSFAAATADTLSSELGMVYGKFFFNCITFKPDRKGADGVVSLEGTLFGIAGAALIAAIHFISFKSYSQFFIITAAGTFGTLFDSVLGALLERKGIIGNNTVNFLNTLSGALVAFFVIFFF